jgi:hypothetical protein
MLKPNLKGKNNKDHPMVQINLECDWRVTILPHTFNSLVTNLLNKWTHDYESVSVSVARTGVLVSAEGR